MTITIDDMLRDVGRELGMRKANYPKWVAGKKFGMTEEKAGHQIACMDALYALLKRAKAEGWPPPETDSRSAG